MLRTIPYRRRREGKTNYRKRLSLLKSGKPRLVVRHSNRYFLVQLVQYGAEGDKVLFSVSSKNLSKYGWKYATGNTPAAYLTGFLAGKTALARNVGGAVFDLGLVTPRAGFRYYAILKGAVDAGLSVPHDPEVFPSEDRLLGKHIAAYYESHKERFARYTKDKINPATISADIDQIKARMQNGNEESK